MLRVRREPAVIARRRRRAAKRRTAGLVRRGGRVAAARPRSRPSPCSRAGCRRGAVARVDLPGRAAGVVRRRRRAVGRGSSGPQSRGRGVAAAVAGQARGGARDPAADGQAGRLFRRLAAPGSDDRDRRRPRRARVAGRDPQRRRRFRSQAASAGGRPQWRAEGPSSCSCWRCRSSSTPPLSCSASRSHTALPGTATWSPRPAMPSRRPVNWRTRTSAPGPRSRRPARMRSPGMRESTNCSVRCDQLRSLAAGMRELTQG